MLREPRAHPRGSSLPSPPAFLLGENYSPLSPECDSCGSRPAVCCLQFPPRKGSRVLRPRIVCLVTHCLCTTGGHGVPAAGDGLGTQHARCKPLRLSSLPPRGAGAVPLGLQTDQRV